ncbi:MAG: hypothetical protein EA380_00875 [Phycisphaeraceae bacterium]|nr:MAG: hypothetical protein EA380_00875 [Phycisphaeraceae bacterium]
MANLPGLATLTSRTGATCGTGRADECLATLSAASRGTTGALGSSRSRWPGIALATGAAGAGLPGLTASPRLARLAALSGRATRNLTG